MFGRVVFSSALALSFHSALVFLRASESLLQGAYTHTEKHMRGPRMRQKIGNREGRTSLGFYTLPSDRRHMLPGNRQDVMERAGFSSKRKTQDWVRNL